ncbi:MAG: GDSL-type esterase/lipase family protein, partial [Oscillospiraceae bacterium]|nr:GDSL-type esterase/lipase family protein [Oscillospiraceae bacterium]
FDPFEPMNLSGYFKNILFLGDSIVSGLELCKDSTVVSGEKVLREAAVVAAVNYSLKNAVSEVSQNSVNLVYAGKAMRPEDIISQSDNKYVFICLGLNDFYGTPLDEYIENYGRLVANIKAKNPDKAIAVLSVTPLVAGQRHGFMTNQLITEANSRLMEFAAVEDLYFIDWAAAIRDENNALYENLCSDGFCHLKPEAYRRLAEYLAGVLG